MFVPEDGFVPMDSLGAPSRHLGTRQSPAILFGRELVAPLILRIVFFNSFFHCLFSDTNPFLVSTSFRRASLDGRSCIYYQAANLRLLAQNAPLSQIANLPLLGFCPATGSISLLQPHCLDGAVLSEYQLIRTRAESLTQSG